MGCYQRGGRTFSKHRVKFVQSSLISLDILEEEEKRDDDMTVGWVMDLSRLAVSKVAVQ